MNIFIAHQLQYPLRVFIFYIYAFYFDSRHLAKEWLDGDVFDFIPKNRLF